MSVRDTVEFVAASESRPVCEDTARVVEGESGEGYAWVLDGSSGYGLGITEAESDGAWYVGVLEDALEPRVLEWEKSLREILEESIAEVAIRLTEVIEAQGRGSSRADAVKSEQLPSATVALVRWSSEGDVVECFNLGDAVNVVRFEDEVASLSTPGLLEELEAETRRLVQREDSLGHKVPLRAESVREQIARTRPAYVNVPSGYWVARVNPLAARFGQFESYEYSEVDSVLVCSDGVSGSVERYGLYGSWVEVLEIIEGAGVGAVVDDVREAEREGGFETSPEAKKHDDIGVGFVSFGGPRD